MPSEGKEIPVYENRCFVKWKDGRTYGFVRYKGIFFVVPIDNLRGRLVSPLPKGYGVKEYAGKGKSRSILRVFKIKS